MAGDQHARDLVLRTLAGDEQAFAELVYANQDVVFALAYQRTRSALDAEDVAQEVFTRAYRDLRRLKKPEAFGSWLYGITLNVAREYVRRRRGMVSLSEIPEPAATEVDRRISPESRQVLDLVAKLPPKYRVPVTLYYIRGLRYSEIAAVLGLEESAARSRVHRARDMIRKRLKRG